MQKAEVMYLAGPEIFGPTYYPWWMLALGIGGLLATIAWVGFWIIRARTWPNVVLDDELRAPTLYEVDAEMRWRYGSQIDQLENSFAAGQIDLRELHLSLAALVRALGSERIGADLEVLSVAKAKELLPMWPQFGYALQLCETPSFSGDPQSVANASLQAAREVIG